LLPLFATSFVGIGGKFTAGVTDTGENFLPVSLTPVENLQLVPAVPVAKFATGGAP
jgi:hypothetical protein